MQKEYSMLKSPELKAKERLALDAAKQVIAKQVSEMVIEEMDKEDRKDEDVVIDSIAGYLEDINDDICDMAKAECLLVDDDEDPE